MLSLEAAYELRRKTHTLREPLKTLSTFRTEAWTGVLAMGKAFPESDVQPRCFMVKFTIDYPQNLRLLSRTWIRTHTSAIYLLQTSRAYGYMFAYYVCYIKNNLHGINRRSRCKHRGVYRSLESQSNWHEQALLMIIVCEGRN